MHKIEEEEYKPSVLGKCEEYEVLLPEQHDVTYVYVIKLKTEGDDIFYYVGKTGELKKRISQHFTHKNIRTPYELDYNIIDLEEVIMIAGETRDSLSVERRVANLMVRREDTLNVIGGK